MFVSNLGCRARCVFCDQRRFSEPVAPRDIEPLAASFLAGCFEPAARRRVLAFYGGSFTGIEPGLLNRYLAVAKDLVERGVVHAAKASTRPDMVSEEVLDLLSRSGFEELEIGCQSFDDSVLDLSGRCHSASDNEMACRLVKASGLRLGIQLMPGLPGEDMASFRRTVERACALRPDTARIYPTVVLSGTALELSYRKGAYEPLDLQEAVRRTLYAAASLEVSGATILRMGLPQSMGLGLVAGPFHPGFGFLVRSEAYRIMAGFAMGRFGGGARLVVSPRHASELLGPGRATLKELTFSYAYDDTIPRGVLRVEAGADTACIQLRDIIDYIL